MPNDLDYGSRIIRKSELRMQLARAAAVRSLATMLSAFVAIPLPGFILAIFPNPPLMSDLLGFSWLAFIIGFSGFVCAYMTKHYCRPNVVCPFCGHSLWDCGTGNFKPRRMQVRNDATACPSCGARIL